MVIFHLGLPRFFSPRSQPRKLSRSRAAQRRSKRRRREGIVAKTWGQLGCELRYAVLWYVTSIWHRYMTSIYDINMTSIWNLWNLWNMLVYDINMTWVRHSCNRKKAGFRLIFWAKILLARCYSYWDWLKISQNITVWNLITTTPLDGDCQRLSFEVESLLALRRRRRKRRWMVRRRPRVPRQLHGLVRRGAPWTLHARAARGRIKSLTEADEKEESEADAEEEIRCTTVPMQGSAGCMPPSLQEKHKW